MQRWRLLSSLISQTVNPKRQKTRSERASVYSGYRKSKGQVACVGRAFCLADQLYSLNDLKFKLIN